MEVAEIQVGVQRMQMVPGGAFQEMALEHQKGSRHTWAGGGVQWRQAGSPCSEPCRLRNGFGLYLGSTREQGCGLVTFRL